MIRKLHRWVIRRKFAKLTAPIDREIEAAQKAHKPTRHLMKRKQAIVHAALAGVRR